MIILIKAHEWKYMNEIYNADWYLLVNNSNIPWKPVQYPAFKLIDQKRTFFEIKSKRYLPIGLT
jgi:hypothetical protein